MPDPVASNSKSGTREKSQPHPHLKDGTVYRQVRSTKLDKIKNLFHHLHFGSVTGHSLCSAGGNGRRETNSQSVRQRMERPKAPAGAAGAFASSGPLTVRITQNLRSRNRTPGGYGRGVSGSGASPLAIR